MIARCLFGLILLRPALSARRVAYSKANNAEEVKSIKVHSANSTEMQTESGHSERKTWTLNYYSIPCVLKDDFTQLKPFTAGLKKTWGQTAGDLLKQGLEQAVQNNCRLCNIEVVGSMLPVAVANSRPWRQVQVTCAAEVTNLQDACFTENGNVGIFDRKHPSPRGICAPCPAFCDAGCEIPGRTDGFYWASTWFKCKTRQPGYIIHHSDSVFPSKGKMFTAPLKYECEQMSAEKLKKYAPEALQDRGSSKNDHEKVPSFSKRKDFARSGEFKLWCNYKTDFSKDISSERKSPDFVTGSRWSLNPGLSKCSKLAESQGDGFLPRLVASVAPKVILNAQKYNCEICDLSLGGSMQAVVTQSTDQVLAALQFIEGSAEPTGHDSLWVKSSCATHVLGMAACNTRLGAVGWESDTSCRPCPKECLECDPITSATAKFTGDEAVSFKCNLSPLMPFPSPTLISMTEDVWHKPQTPESTYRIPEGYECDKPAPRNCGRGTKGWCAKWLFKTHCKFPSDYTPMHSATIDSRSKELQKEDH